MFQQKSFKISAVTDLLFSVHIGIYLIVIASCSYHFNVNAALKKHPHPLRFSSFPILLYYVFHFFYVINVALFGSGKTFSVNQTSEKCGLDLYPYTHPSDASE